MFRSSQPSSSSSSSPSAGPDTPHSSVPSCSSSGRHPSSSNYKQKSQKRHSSPPPQRKDVLSLEALRSTFLNAFPVLSPTSQWYVDDWIYNGVWTGPVSIFAYDSDSESEDESEPECAIKRKPKTKSARKGKGKVKDVEKEALKARTKKSKGGSLWTQVTTHSKSLDVDAVRSADSRIVHCFLRSLAALEDVFLLGTKFSTVLFPPCSCHSKAKVGDSLRIAPKSIGLDNLNIHEFGRVVFPIELRNRWFVVLVTRAWVILYDPAGFSRIEGKLVSQLADHIADAFLADTAKWPDLSDVPEQLDTRIISPDEAIDPTTSAVLVCAALELMVALPTVDDVYFQGLEVSLWFLAECIHKDMSHEQYRRHLAIGVKEAERVSSGGGSPESMSNIDTPVGPKPRVNAPKVPFKAKRRTKRKKVVTPDGPVARHQVSPELAAALRKADKEPAGGIKLDKVLLDRIIWTCKTGQLPGAMCTCELCCEDLLVAGLAGLGGLGGLGGPGGLGTLRSGLRGGPGGSLSDVE